MPMRQIRAPLARPVAGRLEGDARRAVRPVGADHRSGSHAVPAQSFERTVTSGIACRGGVVGDPVVPPVQAAGHAGLKAGRGPHDRTP